MPICNNWCIEFADIAFIDPFSKTFLTFQFDFKILNPPSFFINIYEFHNIHKGFTKFKILIHPSTFVNISSIPNQIESSINYNKLLIKFTTFHLSTSISISWILQHSTHSHSYKHFFNSITFHPFINILCFPRKIHWSLFYIWCA